MLITAYVFIGQQSHMSDMPLLHVICTTVKGNWYRLSRSFIMAAGNDDNCVAPDVYLLVWVSSRMWDHISDDKNYLRCVRKRKSSAFTPGLHMKISKNWQVPHACNMCSPGIMLILYKCSVCSVLHTHTHTHTQAHKIPISICYDFLSWKTRWVRMESCFRPQMFTTRLSLWIHHSLLSSSSWPPEAHWGLWKPSRPSLSFG